MKAEASLSDQQVEKPKIKSGKPVLDRTKFPNIILVGATASGKSTVGYQLSKLLGLGYIDLDKWIEQKVWKNNL